MMSDSYVERQGELIALANSPLNPETFEAATWEVLGNILYDASEEDTRLLPYARPLAEQLATNPDLRTEQSDYYFNAQLALATWGVFSALGRGAPIANNIRLAARRRLGILLADTTDGSFDLDSIGSPAAQKMSETMALALLLRNSEESGTFGLPAPPYLHRFRGAEPNTGIGAFQVYGMSPHKTTPLFVQRFRQDHMRIKELHPGVLTIGLGDFAFGAAWKIPHIIAESKEKGSIKNGQRWLTSLLARAIAQETSNEAAATADERTFIDGTADQLYRRVRNFKG